ncbi:MAG: hypothetical protein GEU98_12750 [Pseudonocardiaceae bacterium]|nr:hypothetical protein [Pseudonocardiaceae bacterium]
MCHGTGTMSWQQPNADGSVLRTIEWDCPNGCGDTWKHPAAEQDRVVEQPDDRPERVKGQADEANKIGGDFIVRALENWGIDHPALKKRDR